MIAKTKRLIYVNVTLVVFGFKSLIGRKLPAQEWLFERLSRLGGIYIKFLQLLAISENTMNVHTKSLKDVLAVYDQVQYENIDIVRLLRSELGDKTNNILLDSTEPIAAGSFAQVYSGVLDNQQIIIKVLRPSVVKFLRFDLALLSATVRIISILAPQTLMDMVSIFDDLKRVTLEEIDYIHEVDNAMHMSEQLANNPIIYIPQTFPEFSTQYIIVQEYIDGLPLTQLLSSNIENKLEYVYSNLRTDLNYVMEELAVELLAGSLEDGGSHGDPHPGNIYILPNNRVALIDFGIGASVQKHKPELMHLMKQYIALYRGEFDPVQFSQAVINYYVPDLTQSMQTLSTYFGKQDLVNRTLQELGQSAAKTLQEQGADPAISSMLDQYRMVYLFTQVINKGNRFGLHLTLEAPAFARSTQIFLHIVHRLGCDKQLLRRSWERVLAANQNLQPAQSAAYDNETIDYSMHTIASWLERLHYSDPGLYKRITQSWVGII